MTWPRSTLKKATTQPLENFEKAMKIMQQIGDRAGEAATFYQFGLIAWMLGKTQQAIRLMAIGFQIFAL